MAIQLLNGADVYGPLDLKGYELRNAEVQNLATDPTGLLTGDKGRIWFNTTSNEYKVWDGSSAQVLLVVGDSAPPSGAASGDLTGNYPAPTIATGVVTSDKIANLTIVDGDISATAAIAKSKLAALAIVDADVAAGAGIAKSKLAGLDVLNADVNAAAAIARSKLDFGTGLVNSDIGAAAAIALSKLATDPLARANHTGTQLASTVSNFDTQVRTSRLDQMAVPTVAVAFNAQRITGLADGTAATDAVTLGQLNSVSSGIDWKASVRLASTANVVVGTGTLLTIDGVVTVAGDRVLLKNQTTATENGIYVAAVGAWTRATDADSSAEVNGGMAVWVNDGTANADTGWVLTTNDPITLGTTSLAFTQFSGLGQVVAGAGLTKTGNTIDVGGGTGITVNVDGIQIATGGVGTTQLADASVTGGTAGAGVKIAALTITDANISASAAIAKSKLAALAIVDADVAAGAAIAQSKLTLAITNAQVAAGAAIAQSKLTLAITNAEVAVGAAIDVAKVAGAVRKYAVSVGNGSLTSITVTHGFGTQDVQVFVRNAAAPYEQVIPDIQVTDNNTVTLIFSSAPAANAYRCVVTG